MCSTFIPYFDGYPLFMKIDKFNYTFEWYYSHSGMLICSLFICPFDISALVYTFSNSLLADILSPPYDHFYQSCVQINQSIIVHSSYKVYRIPIQSLIVHLMCVSFHIYHYSHILT